MYTFSELLKNIRQESGLTQKEFAEKLGVSKVLITKLESEAKEPSKKFVINLANKLKVNPMAIMPTILSEDIQEESSLEKKLINIIVNLQKVLIKKKAKLLNPS